MHHYVWEQLKMPYNFLVQELTSDQVAQMIPAVFSHVNFFFLFYFF